MITALSNSNLPILSGAATFVKSNVRLVIGYFILGAFVIAGGYALSQYVQRQKTEVKLAQTETTLVVTQQRAGTLETIVDQQVKTIGVVTDMRETDAEIAERLLGENKRIVREKAALEKRLQALEQQNETVRAYLDQRIPPELGCLLNESCASGTSEGNRLSESRSAQVPTETM